MPIVKKREFIMRFVEALRQELEIKLPEEGFVYEMQDNAWQVIIEKGKHIRGGR